MKVSKPCPVCQEVIRVSNKKEWDKKVSINGNRAIHKTCQAVKVEPDLLKSICDSPIYSEV